MVSSQSKINPKVSPPSATVNSNYIPFFDAFRGIAVLAVFLFHALGASYGWDSFAWKGLFRDFEQPRSLVLLYPLTYGGTLGVAAFFVISGFCIHLSYTNSSQKGWKAFFWRRFFRIYPAYLLCLLIFFFLWPWHNYSLASAGSRESLISHLFSYHNLFLNTKYGINPSFWSIATEIQLYLFYPLIVLLTVAIGWRRSLLIFLGLELAIRLMAFAVPNNATFIYHFISNSPIGFLFSWSIGAYLAECRQRGRKNILAWASPPLIIFFALILPQFRPTSTLDFTLFALLTGMLVDRLMSIESWTPPEKGIASLLWKHYSFLGAVSFSFYLIHQPILDALKATSPPFLARFQLPAHPSLSIFVGCLFLYPLILLFSWILYRFVEKPSIRLGHQLWNRRT
jgi:peptidoglycan/LPS O-acetylase OafA/YrhL